MQRGAAHHPPRLQPGGWWEARLKIPSVPMKTTELTKLLWQAVNESDRQPLCEVKERLYTVTMLHGVCAASHSFAYVAKGAERGGQRARNWSPRGLDLWRGSGPA
jgi:hypothetical protein